MIHFLRQIGLKYLTLIALLGLGAVPSVTAQDKKPTETKGISLAASSVLMVEEQIPALKGYALQLRTVVLQPGAVAGYHSHAKRPVVAYLVSGEYTEHRDGKAILVHKAGEQWFEGANVAHWSENRGSVPAVLINVELYRAK